MTVHVEIKTVGDGMDTGKGKKGRSAGSESRATAPPTHALPSEPVKVSDKDIAKEHARYEKRRATERWISGQLSTTEHSRVHARADHVLRGKRIPTFKGKTGERKGMY
jgi:hypothetical protein